MGGRKIAIAIMLGFLVLAGGRAAQAQTNTSNPATSGAAPNPTLSGAVTANGLCTYSDGLSCAMGQALPQGAACTCQRSWVGVPGTASPNGAYVGAPANPAAAPANPADAGAPTYSPPTNAWAPPPPPAGMVPIQ